MENGPIFSKSMLTRWGKKRRQETSTLKRIHAAIIEEMTIELKDAYARKWEIDQEFRNIHRIPKKDRHFCMVIIGEGENERSCSARAYRWSPRCWTHLAPEERARCEAWKAWRQDSKRRRKLFADIEKKINSASLPPGS